MLKFPVRRTLFILINIILLFFILFKTIHFPNIILSLMINLIVFVIPGLSWTFTTRFKYNDPVILILSNFLFSSLLLILGLLLFCKLKLIPSTSNVLVYIAVTANTGIVFVKNNEFKIQLKQLKTIFCMAVVFFTAYLGSFWFGINKVDVSLDNDLELQGTAYSMATTLTPAMLTDRATTYYFAHPPLVHIFSTYVFILNNKLEETKYFYEYAIKAEQVFNGKLEVGDVVKYFDKNNLEFSGKIINIDDNNVYFKDPLSSTLSYFYKTHGNAQPKQLDISTVKSIKIWNLIQEEYDRFMKNSLIFETRLIHFYLTALSFAIFFLIVKQISNSYRYSILGTMAYLSLPEMIVLLSYDLYASITNLLLTITAYLIVKYNYSENKIYALALYAAGFLLGISNHKAVIIALAAIFIYIFCGKPEIKYLSKSLFFGFLSGTGLFWLYGFSIDKNQFLSDHVFYHIINRALHINQLGYGGYPSLLLLWNQFVNTYGVYICIISLISLLLVILRKVKSANDASLMFIAWIICGIIVFSIVDWRQVRHLLVVFPALMTINCIGFYHSKGYIKRIYYILFTLLLLNNLVYYHRIIFT